MHLNDKIQQFKNYFSNDFIDKVEKIFSTPYPVFIVLATILIASPSYIKKYIHDRYQKEITEPLIEIQREGWRLDEIREQKEGELMLKLLQDQKKFEREERNEK